jgi:glutamate N-acetyltransferase/amino-acid N-acetyltransferase
MARKPPTDPKTRFDLQQALDPLAAALKGAILRGQDDTTPGSQTPAKTEELPVSPLAPKEIPQMPDVSGATLATSALGVKYEGRPDLLTVQFDPPSTVAGVFTTSMTAAAPVLWCKDNLEQGGSARMLVVNAGNANAFTGKEGMKSCKAVASAAAKAAKCRQRDVFLASTGVVGEPLDPMPLVKALPKLSARKNSQGWDEAAAAMMTTDTFPKMATAQTEIDGVPVTINGIAKGSGMIAPDMATMLAFLVTDAALPAPVLQTLLILGVRDTFNTVTVDGDTSTNDAVMGFATHAARHDPVTRPGDRRLAKFRKAWHGVMQDLALQIVRDGEGATKLVKVCVAGAATAKGAQAVAKSIANSPLVKTAIAGEDANWGRIVMAAGKAGVSFDPEAMTIAIGGHPVATKGARHKNYDEDALSDYMKGEEIVIDVSLGSGVGAAHMWTCDLTHGYIDINADYRS